MDPLDIDGGRKGTSTDGTAHDPHLTERRASPGTSVRSVGSSAACGANPTGGVALSSPSVPSVG